MVNENSLLHICSYYISNNLYKTLFRLLEKNFNQLVYIPIKEAKFVNVNGFISDKTELHYDFFLKPYHKYLYGLKIRSQANRIENHFTDKLSDVKLIHAHTLFSDGGSAYFLSKKFNIPYIVSVRNTDINSFYKYAIHYRPLAHKILINAKKVVFISHAYRRFFLKILPEEVVKKIKHKSIVIPNGISEVFLQKPMTEKNKTSINLITVASLDKNKNISTLIKTVSRLESIGKSIHLKIVGDGPLRQQLEVLARSKNIKCSIEFLGHVDVTTLKSQLDLSNIFVLVSFKETFGISYVEAMARGLPIIYTENQGVDGYFKQGEVGYAVNPNSIDEVCAAIEKIINNYEAISNQCISLSKNFSWNKVNDVYVELYSNNIS